MYEERYREQWNSTFARLNDSQRHPDRLTDGKLIYDTIWLTALALHKTNEELKTLEQHASLDNFTLNPTDTLSASISDRIYNNALNTSFNGATVSCLLFSVDIELICNTS